MFPNPLGEMSSLKRIVFCGAAATQSLFRLHLPGACYWHPEGTSEYHVLDQTLLRPNFFVFFLSDKVALALHVNSQQVEVYLKNVRCWDCSSIMK